MITKNTLLVVGDSWTWGAEIKDPSLATSVSEYDDSNALYRDTHIWPWYLNQKLQFNTIVNLARPACSNDSILRHVLQWLSETGRLNGKINNDVFAIIGFTGPERKDFYAIDERVGVNGWKTFWPSRTITNYFSQEANEFGELYRKYFSNVQESTYRYLTTILHLQMLFNKHGINYLMFQAFYHHKHLNIKNSNDNVFLNKIFNKKNLMYDTLWNTINDVRFVNKTSEPKSFCNYLLQYPNAVELFKVSHPSEAGHELWAEYLYNYIQDKNILGELHDNN